MVLDLMEPEQGRADALVFPGADAGIGLRDLLKPCRSRRL